MDPVQELEAENARLRAALEEVAAVLDEYPRGDAVNGLILANQSDLRRMWRLTQEALNPPARCP